MSEKDVVGEKTPSKRTTKAKRTKPSQVENAIENTVRMINNCKVRNR